MPTKRGMKDTVSMQKPDAPPAPPIHDLDDAEEAWEGSRTEQFTDALGRPGPAVASAGETLPASPASPELLASLAIYREPDGRLSLVRERVPQAFFTIGEDLLAEVKADLQARLGAFGKA